MKSLYPGVCALLLVISCARPPEQHSVRIRIDQFPETFHPLNPASLPANQIADNIYESLELFEMEKDSLATCLGRIGSIENKESEVIFRFILNKNAKWNSSETVSTRDIETTLKVNNLSKIDNQRVRLGFSFIRGLRVLNDSTFEILTKGNLENLRYRVGLFYVLPKHIYDPYGYLDHVELHEIIEDQRSNRLDSITQLYSAFFDSEDFRNRLINGVFGPYRISEWNQGTSVVLTKNENYWGGALDHLKVYPEKLIYNVISDENIALIALKEGAIDVLSQVSPPQFAEMKEDVNMAEKFHFLSPVNFEFTYLAFNSRQKKLHKNIRKAIASLIPYDEIIDIVMKGSAERAVGPISPALRDYYNDSLALDSYDPEQARHILVEEGFEQIDGSWLDANREPFRLNLIYRAGSFMFESIALMLKDRWGRFGLQTDIMKMEKSYQVRRMKSHKFELSLSSFRGSPLATNFDPLFGTEAAKPGGLNHSGFGNSKSDSVINVINFAEEKEQKISASKELQKLLHEEKTMLFLYFQRDRIVVSKRFTNVHGFSWYPGYNAVKFRLRPNGN